MAIRNSITAMRTAVLGTLAFDGPQRAVALILDSADACKKFGVKHGKGQATAVITGYLHGRKPASEKSVAQDKAVVSTHKPQVGVFGWEK